MISIILIFKTKSNKNLEFMQSIGPIIIDVRNSKGCLGIDLQKDDLDKVQFNLQLDWLKQNSIIKFLESTEYEFLEGAINVLCEIKTIEIINGQQNIKTDMHKNRKTSIKKQILYELKHNLLHQK